MEAWELIRRLLAGATGPGQTYAISIIGGDYHRYLASQGIDAGISRQDLLEVAEEFAEDMERIGLIRISGVRRGGPAILGAKERTEFGDELLDALSRSNVVAAFEGMDVALDAGEIRRVLHQLAS